MKILVTGSNGQLGNELKILASQYPSFEFLFTDIGELDITDEKAIDVLVRQENHAAIINCAAYTAVDKAEQEEKMAFLINAKATGNLAKVATRYNALLIHVSTDYIFGGSGNRPYSEEDNKKPVSVYAKSKYAGEQEISNHSKNALILRTSWLYSEFGNNFVKTIMKYGQERGKLNVVFDQVGCPTYAYDLAKAILEILRINNIPEGVSVYHYANEGATSWYDFAKAIVEISGINCRINPIETREYPLPAVRPYYSVLNKAKIKQTFNIEIPYWRDSLKVCIGKMKELLIREK
ncbi:MAG: dTDP-4-dehydrorhamnose reductase [Bacteroidales bacterium]|jgi:dTDP-4-dehydrorhamnose reductase|nr:dTDP-4-dehydrorhamnose reductase [Bacteroidales bacterium]